MSIRPAVSVVVPTFRRGDLLSRALEALSRSGDAPAFEVIVVDDASEDARTRAALRAAALGERLRVLTHATNRGPAAARNTGLMAARGDMVAFTDDDCEPEPTWLAELVCALEAADSQVAGVGGRVTSARPGLIGDYMTRQRILEPPPSLAYLVTANCAFWRAPVVEVGGFDERIRRPGGEDPGLCLALRRRGYRFAFCERAVVRHHYRESLLDFAKTFYRYGKGCRHVVDA